MRLTQGPPANKNAYLASIFPHEDYVLWFRRASKKHVHILVSIANNSLRVHFQAWAHAYVLAKLVCGVPFAAAKTEVAILEKEAGEVLQALNIVKNAINEGGGIENALAAKGWDIERSMICPHIEVNGKGLLDEKTDEIEKAK